MTTEEMAPVIDQLVQERLATGRYKSREEVLLRALQNLGEHDQFMADLESAADDEAAGRIHDAEDVFAEMAAKYDLPN